MSIQNAFSTDVYNSIVLTTAANRVVLNATQLQRMGLFTPKGISAKTFYVDLRDGSINVLTPRSRKAPAGTVAKNTDSSINFTALCYKELDAVYKDDLVGARAIGTENLVPSLDFATQEAIMKMITQNFQPTWEKLQMDALQGKYTELVNGVVTNNLSMYTKLGVLEQNVDFETDQTDTNIDQKCTEAARKIDDVLGGAGYRYHALCGRTLFDAIKTHPNIVATKVYTDPAIVSTGARTFTYGNITFEEYRGGSALLAATDGRIFPVGAPIYDMIFAPATNAEPGSVGQQSYITPKVMDFDDGVQLRFETDPFAICTRPEACIKMII